MSRKKKQGHKVGGKAIIGPGGIKCLCCLPWRYEVAEFKRLSRRQERVYLRRECQKILSETLTIRVGL